MRKNKNVWIVFVLLAAVACGLWYFESNKSIKGELKDFAVADTSSIDKIFLADKEGRTVTLVREASNRWKVNGKFLAREDAIQNLLATIKNVEVRSPVGKNLYNNTMKLMASKSVKIEIYSQDEIIKTYYVGHPTMDNLGTFMYLEGSSVPFITFIPGFNGFLSTRYFASEPEWRDKSIFRFDPRRIVEVEVNDRARPIRAFSLTRLADTTYSVKKLIDGQSINPLDMNKVRKFLNAFSETYFERIDNDIKKAAKDSIFKVGPFGIVKVKMDNGGEKSLACFRKPVTPGSRLQIDHEGEDLPFDLDKFYAIMSDDTSLLVCQYFHFDRILKDPRNFLPGKDVVPEQQRFE
ncbi:MAG: DUF4340 domain-containing protein [Bacteroidetes bacterium]|nr:DUF4340 domain-containing protein [Bacteroidota bacterium]